MAVVMVIAIVLGAIAGGLTAGLNGVLAGGAIGGMLVALHAEREARRRDAEATAGKLGELTARLGEVETALRRERFAAPRRVETPALGPGFTAPLWTPPEGRTIDPSAPFGRAQASLAPLDPRDLPDPLDPLDLPDPLASPDPRGPAGPQSPAPMLDPALLDARRDALGDDEVFGTAADSPRPDAPIGAFAPAAAPQARAADAPDAADAADAPPPPPAEPGLGTRLHDWFLAGNPMAKVGVAILFFGFAFLVKYAYERLQIPIEARLSAVAAFAMALLGVGYRLRLARPDFGLVLQGGGIGLLYLTVFGAIRVWPLLPPTAGFALLAVIAAAAAVLAVAQDSRALAIAGASGGFLAPVLASTGGGSHIALFSYYALLNLGILAVARYRAWRFLNFVGFAFTFVIGTAWGVLRYRPDLYETTQPFLLFFVLLYIAIAILYARVTTDPASGEAYPPSAAPPAAPGRLGRYFDGTLVFGVPIVGFALQAGLVRHFELGTAVSAAVAGLGYAVLATVLHAQAGERMRMLVEAFVAIAVAFATLAIPLALDGRWTAAAWALEGAALVWVGIRQSRLLARSAGYALQIAAAVALVDDGRSGGVTPFTGPFFVGALILAAAGWICALATRGERQRLHQAEAAVPEIAATWALAWLGAGVAHELIDHLPARVRGHGLGAAGAALAALAAFVSRRLDWPYLARLALAGILALAGALALDVLEAPHPSAYRGALAWPFMFALYYATLRIAEEQAGRAAAWLHAATFWMLVALLAWEIGWQFDRWVGGATAWGAVACVMVPAAALALVGWLAPRDAWPVGTHLRGYLHLGGLPVALALAAWLVAVNVALDGGAAPLTYLPILNPLDIGQLGVAVVLLMWIDALEAHGFADLRQGRPQLFWGLAGGFAFLFLNGVLVRTLHHWAGVPFHFDAIVGSKLVQSSLSILWTAIALGATVVATRIGSRALWLVGAALIGTVILKLLAIDLSGGVERIVSFIVVGVLLLAIGYFAPLPPRRSPAPEGALHGH